ncbi:hypothetical protein DFH06DRAFT_1341086 [Mycena polygramma]|nr:hypothetical protein DFH06DRAFT_1341086 [Mycena polygramma]
MICAHIALDGPVRWWCGLPVQRYPLRRRDLARLARTSTIFLNPALDLLWEYQGTLLNLLRTMPTDLWDITVDRYEEEEEEEDNMSSKLEEEEETSAVKIALRRAVIPADWARFIFYSRRVKSFHDHHAFLEDVYKSITSFPEDIIFPKLQSLQNVQSLQWPPLDCEFSHHTRLFPSSRLTHLSVGTYCITDALVSQTQAGEFPRLKDVSIGGTGNTFTVSRFICALRDVETLVVFHPDSEAFSHIARSSRLRHLWLMSNEFVPSLRCPTHLPHFPVLKTLECESIEHAPTFLEQVKPSLVEFNLFARSWRAPPTKRTVQELYNALATNCTHSSLHKILLTKPWMLDGTIDADQLDMYTISGDELKPLFCFQNLVNVSLSHTAGVDLDDGIVLNMARAWTCLQSLSLPPDMPYRSKPRVTLEGVYAFAKYCSSLEDLTILFDATIIPALKVGSRRRTSQHSLESLDVAYSPVGTKLSRLAKFLRTIFPSLVGIRTSYHEHEGLRTDAQVVASHKAWMKVDEAL